MQKIAAIALSALVPLTAAAGEFVERDITAPGPQGNLAGTFTTPETPKAVALILPGSGPTDRDGNGPLGLRTDAYRMLAEALAERGIATLRADKRGLFGSKAAIPDPNDVTLAAYGRDAIVWAASAKAETNLSCTWLIGHSEGGLVALSAVAADERAFCGVVLLATPGRPLGTVIQDQLAANLPDEATRRRAHAVLESLSHGQRVPEDEVPEPLRPLMGPQIQGYLIDLLSQDPGEMTRRYGGPLLIVAGGQDLQVGEKDAQALTQARSDAVTITLPRMNHVLKDVAENSPEANVAAYADPSLPLAPELAATVARFITATEAEPFGLPVTPPAAE